jgi:hypothetical protein
VAPPSEGQPSEAEQFSALTALLPIGDRAQWSAIRNDFPQSQRDTLRLELIGEAIGRGATWAQIGRATGTGGPKAAKAAARRLARQVSRAQLREGLLAEN